MPTKQETRTQLNQLKETIRDTITLLQEHLATPDYTTIRQLSWNLGWHNGYYEAYILEEPDLDPQAVLFTIKVLQAVLEPPTPPQKE